MSAFEENVRITYKKGFFSKKLILEFPCECGETHVREMKIDSTIENKGTKILFYCNSSQIGYQFVLGNVHSNFQLKAWKSARYESERAFHIFALLAKDAPKLTLTDATRSVSQEEATQDDPVVNSNEFLGLVIDESLDEIQQAFDEGSRDFELTFKLLLLSYSDYRNGSRRQMFDIPDRYLSVISKGLAIDELSKAKTAYCHFIKNDYPKGLSILNDLDKDLSPEVGHFLTELYHFKIQNPFCVDGVMMLRPLRDRVLSIREHLEYNDNQLNEMYKMSRDPQDRLFHFGVYQINLVLLLFLAKLLNREEEEVDFLTSRINLEEFNKELRDELSKYI